MSTSTEPNTTAAVAADATEDASSSQDKEGSTSSPSPSPNQNGPVGCYLTYEPSSGGVLMLQYSMGPVPVHA
eukprot:scaffold25312_cov122-Amphora_coffeaeformis.AAC.1